MRGAPEIADVEIEGRPALALRSPAAGIQVLLVPSAGMVCASLTQDDRELLHTGDGLSTWIRTGSTFGIPLLHPWANRLERLSYSAAGVSVLMNPGRSPVKLDENGLPIHGLLHATDAWRVSSSSADVGSALVAARLDAADVPGLLDAFPFPHALELVIALRHDLLTFELTLIAGPERPVPAAFGWHPYLRIPGVPRERWEVTLPVVRQALLDGRGLPTGQTRPPAFRAGPLAEHAFDDLFPVLEQPAEFVVAGGDGALRLRFEAGFPCAQVYTPAGAEFICFEPMTAPTNALRSGEDLPIVESGQTFTATWTTAVTQR